MAIYPCTQCGNRYPQRQQSAYCTVMAGEIPETRKARLCPSDFVALQELAILELTSIDSDMRPSRTCEACESPCTDHVFLTLYPREGEPGYFAGDYCVDHADARLGALGWAKWPPRTA